MPKSPLSQRDWTRLRRAWEAGLSYAELARFSGLSAHAIGRHARKEGWNRDKTEPATDRAVNIDTPLNTAATLFAELSLALREGLARLSASGTENASEARERAALIRAHRKALAALIESEQFLARRPHEKKPNSKAQSHSNSQPHADSPPENSPIELNTRAALAEVTSRLERLQPDDE